MYNRDNQGNALTRRSQGDLSRQRGNDWLWPRDPWREMQEMQRRVDDLFSRTFGPGWPSFAAPMNQMMNQMAQEGAAEPDVDISENETEYIFQAALPGINPNDIEVHATEDSIRLTAQSRSSWEPQQGQGNAQQGQQSGAQAGDGQANAQQQQGQPPATQHRQSRYSRVSRFEFAYTLPEDIKPNEVRANFRNGMLELYLPKAQPSTTRNRAVSIPIQGAEQTQQIPGSAPASAQRTGGNVGAEHQPGSRSDVGANTNQTRAQTSQAAAGTSRTAGKSK
jgi:HSP20 family protein